MKQAAIRSGLRACAHVPDAVRVALLVLAAAPQCLGIVETVHDCAGRSSGQAIVFTNRPSLQTLVVRGAFVDLATGVEVAQSKMNSGALQAGGTARIKSRSSGRLEVVVEPRTPGGIGDVLIHYAVEVAGPDRVYFRAHEAPTIMEIGVRSPDGMPAHSLVAGKLYFLSIKGPALQGVESRFPSTVTDVADITDPPGDNRLRKFRFKPAAAGNLRFAEGSFKGPSETAGCPVSLEMTVDPLTLTVDAAPTPTPAPKPDLRPYLTTDNLVRVTPPESCAGETHPSVRADMCTSKLAAPTATQRRVEGVVQWHEIAWGVENNSDATVTTPFKVRLMFGINVLDTREVTSLTPRDKKGFVYRRPNGARKLMRHFDCPKCYDLGGPGMDWIDPVYTVEVDFEHKVNEGGLESNNNKTFN
jgi:hypothetical protein